MSPGAGTTADYRKLLAQHGRHHWWIAGMRRITWSVLGPVQGRLLDVGCGPGWLLAELPQGVQGVGIDLAAARVAGVVAHRIVAADVSRLPFADAAFDVATALDLLEQAGVEPGLALREIRRVLVPGGRALVRVPAYPQLYGPHDMLWGGARRYCREQLSALVREAGFTIRRLTYANSLLAPIAIVARLAAARRWASGDDTRPLPAPLNRVLRGILTIEARWLASHNFRAGLSLVCLAERAAAVYGGPGENAAVDA